MKKTGKHIVVLAMALWTTFTAVGQDPAFTATVDKNPVSVNDVFSLKLTLDNGRGDITPPDLSDFTVVFGPSRSSSFRIINGAQSSTMTLSYTMRPKRVGTFEIGIAKAEVKGKVLTTAPIKVEVVKGSSTQTKAPATSHGGTKPAATQSRGNNNLMVRIRVSKSRVFRGEQVVATYVLLSRYSNIDLGDIDFPTLNGFWIEDIKTDQASWEPDLETINGISYRKAILRRQVLFPQRTGNLEIPSFTMSGRVNRSFFSPGEELNVRSNSPKIEVLPLPDPVPISFDGAVGQFDLKAELDRKELPANEAINLKLTLSGRGNLTLVDAPKVRFPDDFETYDPEATDRIRTGAAGVRGSRTFRYLAIPRYPGEYEIPAIKFSYFDPSQKEYITSTYGPYHIKVTGSGTTAKGGGAPIAKNRVKPESTDVRYIITDAERLRPRGQMFFDTFGYWAGLTAPLVALLVFVGFRRRQHELAGDVVGRKRRGAKGAAKRRLKSAAVALKAQDAKLFYAEVFKALYGYLGDKMNIAPSDLTKQTIKEELLSRGVNETTVDETLHTIATAEMARFAPTTDSGDELFYQKAASLIEKLQERLR